MRLAYGTGHIELDATGMNVLRPGVDLPMACVDGAAAVRDALRNPLGAPQLADLARGKCCCTVIISDHTRPVPSKEILPALLEELRRGEPEIEVTLLVATAVHRGTTESELIAKLGSEIVSHEKIVVHDAQDAAANVSIGVLPSGAPLVIDRLAAEADLLVSEGFIEPHFFAGFSGGRKSVLPGICDRVTVLGNHCSRFIDDPCARAGILEGNPIHKDMIAAAKMAELAFIVNVVIDADKRIVAAFAGDSFVAHETGCEFLRPYSEIVAEPADIVITTNGGAPLDQNIYQCAKGLTAAEAIAKPGGVLVMLAECADGTGSDGLYHALSECSDPAELYASFMATPQNETLMDQWESQIYARILMSHKVIFVTRPELASTIRDMKMHFAATIEEALMLCHEWLGQTTTIAVIPDGISVIVKPKLAS